MVAILLRHATMFGLATIMGCTLLTFTLKLEDFVTPGASDYYSKQLYTLESHLFQAQAQSRMRHRQNKQWRDTLVDSIAGQDQQQQEQKQPSEGTPIYRDPIPHDLTPAQLPLPVKIMETYKRKHSVEALQSNPNSKDRQFAVGFIVCPLSAGNRLHEYFNWMLWAILTNRTLLWKYYDRETCLQYAERLGQDLIHCDVANKQQDCEDILQISPWMPSYDEWVPKLGLKASEIKDIPKGLNNPKLQFMNKKDPKKTGVDTKFENFKIVLFPHRTNSLDFLGEPDVMKRKFQTKEARQLSKGLFSMGTNFLYGMLHRYAFDFTPAIQKSVPAALLESTTNSAGRSTQRRASSLDNYYTIAVHSRHNDSRIDGCDITNEKRCLDKVMQANTNNKQCRVTVMADRTCTISTLTNYLKEDLNCVVDVAEHQAGNGTYAEHGPFAGSGYFQDLALGATLTRDAIVGSELHDGMWRSSSLLLMELVEFHKQMEAVQYPSKSRDTSIEHCMLPKNHLTCHGWGIC